MGSCYSRKASGGNYTYTTVPMASTKHEEVSRIARPTPYSRNSNFAFKRYIQPSPQSIPQSSFSSHPVTVTPEIKSPTNNKNIKGDTNLPIPVNNITRLNSSIPSKVHNLCDSDTFDSQVRSQCLVDSNLNRTTIDELHNSNNNESTSDISTAKTNDFTSIDFQQTTKGTSEGKSQSSLYNRNQSGNMSNSAEKIDSSKTSSSSSKIPAKLTAHISGLPRPQVPHLIEKANSSDSNIPVLQDEELRSLTTKWSQERNCYAKEQICDKDIQQDEGELNSNDAFPDVDSIADFDSGLGNSVHENAKQEDSETLKDVDHIKSYEGSPVSQPDSEVVSTSVDSVTSKTSNLTLKESGLKSPVYRRQPGGGWNLGNEEKNHINILQRYNIQKNGSSYTGRVDVGKKLDTIYQQFSSDKKGFSRETFSDQSSLSQPTYSSYRFSSYKRTSPLSQISEQFHKNDLPLYSKYTQRYDNSASKVRKQIINKDNSYYKSIIGSTASGANKSLTFARKESPKAQHSSPELREKSGNTCDQNVDSPVSELENREFLIDDEISDQPGLISFENIKCSSSPTPSLHQSVAEMLALQAANNSIKFSDLSMLSSKGGRDRTGQENLLSCSDIGSSCSSLASDDLMVDYDKAVDKVLEESANERMRYNRKTSVGSSSSKPDLRNRSASLPLRPPRPMSITEIENGSIKLDGSSYRLLCQDLNGVKTLLFRLKNIIQEAETLNPFDNTNTKNMLYHTFAYSDSFSESLHQDETCQNESELHNSSLVQKNADLCRQVVLLRQQLEEKNQTINLLQQQMTKYANIPGIEKESETCNAATQTEKVKSRTDSFLQDDTGTLVSSKVLNVFEDYIACASQEETGMMNRMDDLRKSLSSLNQSLRARTDQYSLQIRSSSSSDLHSFSHDQL